MSNTFDDIDMPFKSEITDYWDFRSGINNNAWVGCINGLTFTGGDDCLTSAENYAAVKNSFSADFGSIYASTVYIITQMDISTALSDWYTIYGAYGTAPQFNLCNRNGCFAIGTGSSNGWYVSDIKTYNEWHICAAVQNNGYGALYIDGNLLYSYDGYYYPVGHNKMHLNGDGYTLNTKMLSVFNGTAHTSDQISQFVNWLQIQYGFKSPEKNSRLAGTDAVAIAYAIAKNNEITAGLQEIKKAYRDGLKEGVDGGADIKEDYTQDGANIDMTTDENGGISEPFIGSLTDGVYYTDPTGAYVHMYLDMSWTETSSDGAVKTGRMVYDAYDSGGVLVDTYTTIGTSGWAWNYVDKSGTITTHVDRVAISGSKVICTHTDGTLGYNIDWSPYGKAATIMSNAVRVSNIPPEIIT